jgi:hypothetical protein
LPACAEVSDSVERFRSLPVSKAGNVAAARHAPLLSARFDRAAHGQADWSVADALMLKTLAAAEKVARYRHAQLSAFALPATSMRRWTAPRLMNCWRASRAN